MTELLARQQRVFWLEESGLHLRDGVAWGDIAEVLSTAPFLLGAPISAPLQRHDALLVRKDPPFDQRYLHLTLILDHLPDTMQQFNSVAALRNFNEKLLPLRWPEFAPPSLLTANALEILTFMAKHQTIVLKPLDDCSGRGIVRMHTGMDGLDSIERHLEASPSASPFVIAQRFLPEVAQGDKRIYVLDGAPVGWVNRVPAPRSYLANIHQGARCEPTELTAAEVRVIRGMAPFLQEQGIFFAGLDFIGGYLTEVNITSPSAILQINEAMNERIEVKLVDGMLDALANQRGRPGVPQEHRQVAPMFG